MAGEAQLISISQPEEEQQAPLINLQTEENPPVPENVATKRSSKATFGLTQKIPDKTYDDYYRSIANGQEPQIRKNVSTTLDYQRAIDRYKRIQDFATAKGDALTPEDLDNLQNFINVPPADPRSVFEDNYSKRYMDTLRSAPGFPGSWYDDVATQYPQLVQSTENVGSELMQKMEYARTNRENAEVKSKAQSYFGDVIDRAKEMIPGYVEYNQRMSTPSGESMFQGLLGTQLNELAKEGLRLPPVQFKNWFDSNFNRLLDKDPQMAVTFAHAVEGQSMSDTTFNNIFTLGDITGIYGTTKGTIKVIRGLATKELDRREIQDITKQMAQSSIGAQKAPVQVVAHAAAGDLGEAAVQQSTANAMSVAAGTANLEEMALNKRMSFLKAQQDNMRATFGNYGQEVVNRIILVYVIQL